MNTYSAIESAQLTGVGYSTIRRHIGAGKLRATRHGRALRITERELHRVYPAAFGAKDSAHDTAHNVTSSAHTERSNSAHDTAISSAQTATVGAHTTDSDVLRVKLEASERAHEATRRELDVQETNFQHSQQQLERTQGQLDESLASVRALTDEIKGLTAMIHAHRALPSPVGWLRSAIGQLITFRI